MYDAVADKFSDVISLIDEDAFGGNEKDLIITVPQSPEQTYAQPLRGGEAERALFPNRPPKKITSQEKPVNVFSKLDYYLNSNLPVSLPPLRVYMPTYPLLCLAAQYSMSAYLSPQSSKEKKDYVSADGRLGTKAMVIKSVPCDDKKTVVFAIRGTSMLSIRDWGVNLDTDPVSPTGFLDDSGNLCHAGFLKVARAMVRPIAARLRALLEENPNRTGCSLLITGHSAGGAVASLLYAHMLSRTVRSELRTLTDCFKRVHCVTFGAPPVSLLPLQKSDGADHRLRKCLFHSIMNEGDPVVRANKAYVRSLIDLLSAPTPSAAALNPQKLNTSTSFAALGASMSRLDLTLKPQKTGQSATMPNTKAKRSNAPVQKLWWDVPPAALSNAGRLVVLRVPKGKKESESVTACVVTDEQLRQVIFGDPLMHQMEVYQRRVEALAFRAVTGRLGAC
jgi:Lipase (class 3)